MKELIERPADEPDIERLLVGNLVARHAKHFNPHKGLALIGGVQHFS